MSPSASTAAGPARPPRSAFPFIGWFVFLAALAASWRIAEVRPLELLLGEGRDKLFSFVKEMFPPDLSAEFLGFTLRPAIETLQISILGTALAVVIGFPLSLLAASNLSFTGVLHEAEVEGRPALRALRSIPYVLARSALNVFRAVPEFVWALIFVRAVGLGPFPGVLAIGVGYGGVLGKVFAEIFEEVSPQPLEALQATGASRLSTFFYGFLPQALPNLASYALYRWECAIRAAAILGFVGAGGIGQQIEVSMRMFKQQETLTLILILLVMVTAVDRASAWIRKQIL
ncbi:MAG: phosphonate ABC transporter, permease protein PhnE [Candidatus Tectomicrobia bacterium]|nr:phosphonate ABC transporter, permease protein PhnE [Candidatus Tectomicrobia bacterium]